MFTISDLFKDDLPDGAIFVLEYPSSHKTHFGNPSFLVNSSKYLADDEYRDHDYESNRIEKPHRNLCVLGNKVRAYVAEPPANELFMHWQRQLGTEPLRYAELGDTAPHVCLFPLQDIPADLHAIDPDVHYHIYSKNFIGEIDCPQPTILTELKVPSVLKVGRSSGGHGTWIIQKEEDYDYWIEKIRNSMPYAETVLTEMVHEIKHNLCCHFYLSRSGDLTTLAITEKLIDNDVIWIGAVLQMSRQDELKRLIRATTDPVCTALHERGFFGLFGIDVLIDSEQRQFVVDINPRILGSTPLVFSHMSFEKRGLNWEVSIFLTGVVTKALSIEALVERAESVSDGQLIIYSIIEKGADTYCCQIAVFGKSVAECRAIAETFY